MHFNLYFILFIEKISLDEQITICPWTSLSLSLSLSLSPNDMVPSGWEQRATNHEPTCNVLIIYVKMKNKLKKKKAKEYDMVPCGWEQRATNHGPTCYVLILYKNNKGII